eukprot:TRINITY_DN26088_c0_g1_i1.p1 TRINITY_DN26088_c0_g1~~TRINITY_DN26088_c0_g1_i1.p1  ORF type:complete len:196 (+),score=14.14 TRINITY_DN26088_c0_g1_i1:70-657(+)
MLAFVLIIPVGFAAGSLSCNWLSDQSQRKCFIHLFYGENDCRPSNEVELKSVNGTTYCCTYEGEHGCPHEKLFCNACCPFVGSKYACDSACESEGNNLGCQTDAVPGRRLLFGDYSDCGHRYMCCIGTVQGGNASTSPNKDVECEASFWAIILAVICLLICLIGGLCLYCRGYCVCCKKTQPDHDDIVLAAQIGQ